MSRALTAQPTAAVAPAALRMTDLSPQDRPRERLWLVGAAMLSTAELLAILLRVGVRGESALQLAQRVLVEMKGVVGLMNLDPRALADIHGIGKAKAAQLSAAVELGQRVAGAQRGERPRVSSAEDAWRLLAPRIGEQEQEHVVVMLLDTRNQLIDIMDVYTGSLNASMIRIGELFRFAVRNNAANIIVAHNHPSGDPTPSPEDVAVTRLMVDAGKLLDIPVLDHIVIGHQRFVSLKERGVGFS
ncbi:MAG: JAB domain-containing protein [Chloroflexi bacterium]|nr:MAG: JAB domain-containing protein [Chloroflexota bacterium]RLT53717.1 MAG: JAB domain-containing protein [Chloroflexota bacterium]